MILKLYLGAMHYEPKRTVCYQTPYILHLFPKNSMDLENSCKIVGEQVCENCIHHPNTCWLVKIKIYEFAGKTKNLPTSTEQQANA